MLRYSCFTQCYVSISVALYVSVLYLCLRMCVCVSRQSRETTDLKELKHYHKVISKKLSTVQ